jgi:hypothetical protein
MPYSDQMSRKVGCVVSIVLVISFAALPVAWLVGRPYTSTLPRSFESEAWKAANPTGYPDDDTRCSMVADLHFRIGIEGKTREELVGILGEPETWRDNPATQYWPLCPSFLDVWVLTVRWRDGRAVEAVVHDT